MKLDRYDGNVFLVISGIPSALWHAQSTKTTQVQQSGKPTDNKNGAAKGGDGHEHNEENDGELGMLSGVFRVCIGWRMQ
jgi:hypothetical protein